MYSNLLEINFTSPTGTGKTKMISKLINKLPNYYFIITTLSKSRLQDQTRQSLQRDCVFDNWIVYGDCDYKINSRLTANDIINRIPKNAKIIWIRDEGHRNTNRFSDLLNNIAFKIINFSATNRRTDINCNFTHTVMLRTVHQYQGYPEDAINKLIEIKKIHKDVSGYNPCAIFRIASGQQSSTQGIIRVIENLCHKNNLKYVNIIDDDYDPRLCDDDCDVDVIINKFKIVEGIDIRRAHIIYFDNWCKDPATTIQAIGRTRRNALIYRNDFDVFSDENKKLFEETRNCYVYFNANKKMQQDDDGNLLVQICDTISVQDIKPDSVVHVTNGVLDNGLRVKELCNLTGDFRIIIDKHTGFNITEYITDFYKTEIDDYIGNSSVYMEQDGYIVRVNSRYLENLPIVEEFSNEIDWSSGKSLLVKRYSLLRKTNKVKKQRLVDDCDVSSISDVTRRIDFWIKTFTRKSSNNVEYESIIYPEHIKRTTDNFFNIAKKNIKKIRYSTDDFLEQQKKKILENYLTYFNTPEVRSHEPRLENYIALESLDGTLQENDYMKIVERVSYRTDVKKYGGLSRDVRSVKQRIEFYKYRGYTKILNDYHSAAIGFDLMKLVCNDTDKYVWIEDKSVSSKISKYSKFKQFIENEFSEEINLVDEQLFNGRNEFNFPKDCNKCLGWLVEYYSKYIIYGFEFFNFYKKDGKDVSFGNYLYRSYQEHIGKINSTGIINCSDNFKFVKRVNDIINKKCLYGLIVRACIFKYKDMMREAYGDNVTKLIKSISSEKLISENYQEFCKTVIDLATKTANFIKNQLFDNVVPKDDISPILSINHISGLADYITEDTIIDIKTTSNIKKEYILQVLGYYYLSTKRSDLKINRVIVYDCVSNRCVIINIDRHKHEHLFDIWKNLDTENN